MVIVRPQPDGVEAAFDSSTYVGTLVGGSTSREFRLAVAHEEIREQDIIAVDATLRHPGSDEQQAIRVWAKVQEIERLNPLFPIESAQELASTRTNPLDTVLSLSREMVTAVCQVLGYEPVGPEEGAPRLRPLRYPPQPATSAFRPMSADIRRIVVGALNQDESLDVATLANRPDIDVAIDGHAVVSRHLALLAMTGAGKSWSARRIIEELAKKRFPIVIFDPHGDYTGLMEYLPQQVRTYFAHLPVFDEDDDTIAKIIGSLGYELSPTMEGVLPAVIAASRKLLASDQPDEVLDFLRSRVGDRERCCLEPTLWFLANVAEAAEHAIRAKSDDDKRFFEERCWDGFARLTMRDASTLEAIKKRSRKAAAALQRMENMNKRIARPGAAELPTDRTALVDYGRISVVSLAGYSGEFQATIYELIARDIFDSRVRGDLKYPVLLLLEEAHNFVPGRAMTPSEERSVSTTRQIAQEGRKFGVGLVLISQRPSRLDETALSQCNSYLIMRLANPADQNFVRKVIETLGEYEANLLPDLEVGEALLSGQFTTFPILAHMKRPGSPGARDEESAFTVLRRAHQEVLAGRPPGA
jgi:uncharacterized protein